MCKAEAGGRVENCVWGMPLIEKSGPGPNMVTYYIVE
jgi:hypothetical protein